MIIKALTVKIDGSTILKGVNLTLGRGLNVILGPNGSGKTTLLRTLIRMIEPSQGEVHWEEREVGYSPAEFFPAPLRVIDVMRSGSRLPREVYLSYLDGFQMRDYWDRDFSTLSSGEKRMVLVAKAFAEGNTVIMDEPLSNLDSKNYTKVVRAMRKFSRERTIITTSHDLELAGIADHVVLMKEGIVMKEGEPSRVLDEEVLYELYGVKVRMVKLGERIIFVKDIYDL